MNSSECTMMIMIRILLFLVHFLKIDADYSLYYSNQHRTAYPIFDCLYAHLIDSGRETGSRYIRNQYLIPYCRRPDSDDEREQYPQLGDHILRQVSFDELKNNDITSDQLLLWNAPIDTVERYAMDLTDFDQFYLCSSPWFGKQCQYRFDTMANLSFGDIVRATFKDYSHDIRNNTQGSCYLFIEGCHDETTWPLCLDWRQICDGKMDCRQGEDERECEQLELTRCNDDEYRCHFGGQCIPKSFAKDSRLSIDCLDGSDENDYLMRYSPLINPDCPNSPTFQCQERISRYQLGFHCGDGSFISKHHIPNRHVFCSNNRDREMTRVLLTAMDHIDQIQCRQAFQCGFLNNRISEQEQLLIVDSGPWNPLFTQVSTDECEPLSKHCASEWLMIPEQPILFDYFQLIYFTNRSIETFQENIAPDIICFNPERCPSLVERVQSRVFLPNRTCFSVSNVIETNNFQDLHDFFHNFLLLNQLCLLMSDDHFCQNDSYFHCNQSLKCISKNRVGDGSIDCFYQEDETFNTCSWNETERIQCLSDPDICLLPVALGNGYEECPEGEDELFSYTNEMVKLVTYPMLCNNDRTIKTVDELSENDETSCDLWPCNNPYTNCNYEWDCSTGFDELNCSFSQCSSDQFECRIEETNENTCVPFHQIYDKKIDRCQTEQLIHREFYFFNNSNVISDDFVSWAKQKCLPLNDICRDGYESNVSIISNDTCLKSSFGTPVFYRSHLKTIDDEIFCDLQGNRHLALSKTRLLVTERFGYDPPISIDVSPSPSIKIQTNFRPEIDKNLRIACQRGIAVITSLNQTIRCLCPPNFYGSKCQWQSQRISLTIQFLWRNTLSEIVIFQVVILLIDQFGNISPYHEQLTYIPTYDCDTKFHFYLLYPHRPKQRSIEYFIRIDLYEKTKFIYWTSWFLPIPFAFLPVNRIATQLIIPDFERDDESCPLDCGDHGQCRTYSNDRNRFFCQCERGYSGLTCTKTHHCPCATDSLCLSSSICVCPLYKFGSYCYLNNSICQSTTNPCQHESLCIPTDDRINRSAFVCFCSEEFSGERCENRNNFISIDFGSRKIQSHSLIVLHFISVFDDAEHERTTILKKTLFNQQNLNVRFARPFHLLFLEISQKFYYLLIVRERYFPSESIQTTIEDERLCLSIEQLIDEEIVQQSYLQRTKIYPSICRQYRTLRCFFDDRLMCFCDQDRFANCFLFNHTMTNDCQGYNICENDGHCYQNNDTCPTKSTCICSDCYYGARCQFSTKGNLFSLDPILGYHIRPHLSLDRQPSIVKTSIGIISVMFVFSLINTILSLMTFIRKKPREVGSGIYLFLSSITSFLVIIALNIKFWYLLYSQMFFIETRSLLLFTCITNDFILKILLASTEWLNACVSIERMVSVTKATNFKREKSKNAAKWVILLMMIFICLTHLHDPISRRLIDDRDADEERIWCLVRYSSSLRIYNTFVTFFHFLLPFSINILSALYIIRRLAHHRSSVQPDRAFHHHFQHQMVRHQNLIFAPCALTILCLPRLVTSLSRVCIRSTKEPWFYLIGYFISFVPSILTFIIFVIPSKHYRKEFRLTFDQTFRRFRHRFF